PHLIPEEWKKDGKGNTRYIFFWGTIYRYRNSRLCVRCLYWEDGSWNCTHYWLDDGYEDREPAAVRAA
ncbi:MAG: hypothetical protein AAB901_01945, partial [Patescibacteria group bacterium]